MPVTPCKRIDLGAYLERICNQGLIRLSEHNPDQPRTAFQLLSSLIGDLPLSYPIPVNRGESGD